MSNHGLPSTTTTIDAAELNAWNARQRIARSAYYRDIADSLCQWPGCEEARGIHSDLCETHRQVKRQRAKAASDRARRAKS